MHRLLVIDDSETNNLLIKSLFEESNKFEVHIENNPVKAYKRIKEISPDIILLDIMMPRKDGISILKEIKADPDVKDIPVIVVSAKQDQKDEKIAKEAGALDYIRKPIGINNLYARINQIFQDKKN